MLTSPKLVALLRLIFIICLTLSNAGALWRASRPLKNCKSRHFNRLVLICILLVNLFYVSFVWTPFTISAFSHYVRLHNNKNHTLIVEKERLVAVATTRQNYIPELDESIQKYNNDSTYSMKASDNNVSDNIPLQREARSTELEPEGHEGKWSLAFPVKRVDQRVIDKPLRRKKLKKVRRFPEYIGIDCTFQDIVSCASVYSLAFISVINMILTKKPIFLPMTTFSMPGYIFLLTGIPVLATFAIRYSEQIGTNFAPHDPDTISCGYTVYNVICDVHIDDNYVFLSFLEWAGLTMVLLVTVTIFLGLSTKAELNQFQYEGISSEGKEVSSFVEKASRAMGPMIRDFILYIATLWAWPLKPTVLLVLYVLYGRHWTNSASWISHFILSISTVLLPTSTLLSPDMCSVEDTGDEIDSRKEKKLWKARNKIRKGSCSDVIVIPSQHNLPIDAEEGFEVKSDLQEHHTNNKIQTKNDEQIHQNFSSRFKPSVADCKKPFQFAKFKNEDESNYAHPPPSILAGDVRKKIMQFSEGGKTSVLANTAPLRAKGDGCDRKLILQNEESYSSNTSDV